MPFYHGLKDYPEERADWIARRLVALRADLSREIGLKRKPNSLIVGSWNIRSFDWGLPRLDDSFHFIAEIIAAFDICAIQEVKSDLGPLKRLLHLLGPNWDFFVTDISDHEGGNGERMALVYNKDKVRFRNLVGEIVVRSTALSSGLQIARSPFFAAFQAGWFRFTLVSSHIIYGKADSTGLAARAEEITAISEAILRRAKTEDQVYIFLGDMNIESQTGVVMQALRDSGLHVPPFGPSNMAGNKFYDQIAYTVDGKDGRKTTLQNSGVFDWRNAVYPYPDTAITTDGDRPNVTRPDFDDTIAHYAPLVAAHRAHHGKAPYADFRKSYKRWNTEEMSDHLPVWVELETDYSDDYLMRFFQS